MKTLSPSTTGAIGSTGATGSTGAAGPTGDSDASVTHYLVTPQSTTLDVVLPIALAPNAAYLISAKVTATGAVTDSSGTAVVNTVTCQLVSDDQGVLDTSFASIPVVTTVDFVGMAAIYRAGSASISLLGSVDLTASGGTVVHLRCEPSNTVGVTSYS